MLFYLVEGVSNLRSPLLKCSHPRLAAPFLLYLHQGTDTPLSPLTPGYRGCAGAMMAPTLAPVWSTIPLEDSGTLLLRCLSQGITPPQYDLEELASSSSGARPLEEGSCHQASYSNLALSPGSPALSFLVAKQSLEHAVCHSRTLYSL